MNNDNERIAMQYYLNVSKNSGHICKIEFGSMCKKERQDLVQKLEIIFPPDDPEGFVITFTRLITTAENLTI